MKRRVPGVIKRLMAALSNKTNELRTRVMIFFLLHRNQSMLLEKLQTAVAGRHAHRSAAKVKNEADNDDVSSHVDYVKIEPEQAFSYTQAQESMSGESCICMEDYEEDNDNENENENENEEDIDQAAELFIERFRRQILLQKQLSLRENDVV